jgi:hypothetical protein
MLGRSRMADIKNKELSQAEIQVFSEALKAHIELEVEIKILGFVLSGPIYFYIASSRDPDR